MQKFLKNIFLVTVIFRFIFPFYYNPINALFSDTLRHWNNGHSFFSAPNFINAMDAKAYQIYIFLLQVISNDGENRAIIALVTGILCASFSIFWLKFFKEVFSRKEAYIFAIIFSIFPSFFGIYSLFMSETLMLTWMGLSTWLTFRYFRKKDFPSLLVAIISLIILCFIKLTNVIFIMLFIAAIILRSENKVRNAFITSVIFLTLTFLSGNYNYKVAKIFAPFGFIDIAKPSFYSDKYGVEVNSNLGTYNFVSPSYSYDPFYPFNLYKTHRKKELYQYNIDVEKGQVGWNEAIEKAKREASLELILRNKLETAIFFVFGGSWPDSGIEPKTDEFFKQPNSLSRWIWAPLFIFVIFFSLRTRCSTEMSFIILANFVTLLAILLLSETMLEGRYRKAIEPYTLIAFYAYLKFRLLKSTEPTVLENMYNFAKENLVKLRSTFSANP